MNKKQTISELLQLFMQGINRSVTILKYDYNEPQILYQNDLDEIIKNDCILDATLKCILDDDVRALYIRILEDFLTLYVNNTDDDDKFLIDFFHHFTTYTYNN